MEKITAYLIQSTVNEHGGIKAWEETILLPTYEAGEEEKNPIFLEKRVYQGSSGVVYPYPVVEKVSDEKKDKPYKALFIENEYIKVMILPELGGRIHMAYDKVKQRHFVYYNQVVKPALVGLTGPWISGGIEFNWPQHHRPSTFLPTDYSIEEHADGSITVWCNEVERMFRTKGMQGFRLYPDKAYIEINVKVYNRSPFPQTFLWWANPAVVVNDHYHSVFPPDVHAVFDHGKRDVSGFPIATGTYYKQDYSAGVDISKYKNIPVPTSYMAVESKYNFVGGYEEDTRGGLLHVADHHVSPGKKQWTWGNGDFGQAWDRNLTDEDGPYIELMTGVFTDNQPDFSWLQPGEEKSWTQYFMPYAEVGYVKNASKEAMVNVELSDGMAYLIIYTTSEYKDLRIVLKKAKGATCLDTASVYLDARADISPRQVYTATVAVDAGILPEELLFTLYAADGRQMLTYQADKPEIKPIPDPAKAARLPKEIASMEQLYLTALHLEQYRHATYNPADYYLEALQREPGDVRCNNGMGLLLLRKGQFAQAEPYFRQAIRTLTERNPNPYDGEPYYNLGWSLKMQGRNDEAYDAFYKSVWNASWQDAGYFALAQIDAARQEWESALDKVERSLIRNWHNHKARQLKASVLRKLGRKEEALAWIADSLAIDRFNMGCRFEKYLLTGDDCELAQLTVLMRGATHPYLEYALDFAAAGLYAEASQLLSNIAPRKENKVADKAELAAYREGGMGLNEVGDITNKTMVVSGKGEICSNNGEAVCDQTCTTTDRMNIYPMVYYALGYFASCAGQPDEAVAFYRKAACLPSAGCFPNRMEEVNILQDSIRLNPADASAQYYLGNYWYAARQYTEAVQCWEEARRIAQDVVTAGAGACSSESHSANNLFPSVLRNLALAYYNKYDRKSEARVLLEEAFRLDSANARLLMELDQLHKKMGVSPAERLANLEAYAALTEQRDDLCIERATLYNQIGQYEQAKQLIAARKFHPWEGGEGKVTRQYIVCRLALAGQAMEAKDYRKALDLLHETDRYPHNLGEGKLANAEENDIDYYKGIAYRGLGDEAQAVLYFRKATVGSSEPQQAFFYNDQQPDKIYYQGLAWEALGESEKARSCYNKLIAHGKKHLFDHCRIDYFAVSLPDLAIWDDDLDVRNQIHCNYVIGLGMLGLGEKAEARTYLSKVLELDINHLDSQLMLNYR